LTGGDKCPEGVIADSQVQDQLPADAPVVLPIERPAIHGPSVEFTLLHIQANRTRRVAHDIVQSDVADPGIGAVRRSSFSKIELAAKLPRVGAAEHRKLLLDMVARRNAPLLAFALSNSRHTGVHDCGNAAPHAPRSFGSGGTPLVQELFDSLSWTGIDAEVGGRGPASPADHIRCVSAQHLAPERARIQRLLSCLVLDRMRSAEGD